MVDFDKRSEDDEPKDFGQPFDYDATAEASLSEQPATTEAGPSHGGASATGPGWDTYSGVGNGPGWGEMPSYPAPSNPTENYPVQGYPTQGYPAQNYSVQNYSTGYPNQYPQSPQQGQFGAPAPGYGYPPQPMYGAVPYGYGVGAAADAPFGRDPITGEAMSNRSKVAAGLLQIFFGGFGAGRFYIGSNGVAVAQLLLLIFGWCTSFLGVGLVVLFGLFIWVVVDGIVMLVGNVKDGNGRKLRN